MGCGVAMTILQNKQIISLESTNYHLKHKQQQNSSVIQTIKISPPEFSNLQNNMLKIRSNTFQENEPTKLTSQLQTFQKKEEKKIKIQSVISSSYQETKIELKKGQSDAILLAKSSGLVNKQISKETLVETNVVLPTIKAAEITNNTLPQTSILNGVKQNKPHQRVVNKRQSVKIEHIINKKDRQQPVNTQQKKGKVNVSNRSLKKQVSRKDLKIKKQMIPVDSLYLQSIIATPQESLNQKQNKVVKTKQSIKSQLAELTSRNAPSSRNGGNKQIISIGQNLKKSNQNQIKSKEVLLQKQNSKIQLQKKSESQKDQLKGGRLGSKQSNVQRRKITEDKKKAEEDKRKNEEKKIQEAKKQLATEQKKAIKVETDKLKKLYNL